MILAHGIRIQQSIQFKLCRQEFNASFCFLWVKLGDAFTRAHSVHTILNILMKMPCERLFEKLPLTHRSATRY